MAVARGSIMHAPFRSTFAASACLAMNLTAAQATASELEDAVATMTPGTWLELPTQNIAEALLDTGGSSNMIFGYAESMRWDPVSRQAFYLGSDHGGDYRFVAYRESDNSWVVKPFPSWYTAEPPNYSDAHGYDQTAVDPASRLLFRRPYNGNSVYVWDIDGEAWSQLPDPPFAMEYGSCCDAIDYFPELGGLVWSRGTDSIWLHDSDWSLLGDSNGISGTWLFAEYNPVHAMLIFGSAQSGMLYHLSSAGEITPAGDLPVSIYDGSAWNGVVTVDPIAGDYLVLTPTNRELHIYDALTDTWELAANQPPDLVDGGLVAAPLDTHGVTMFTHCRAGTCRVLLYKHSPGSGTGSSSSSSGSGGAGASTSGSGGAGANQADDPGSAGEASGCSCRAAGSARFGSAFWLIGLGLALGYRRLTSRSRAR
jgi:MYXO-CTERM domain-containing protein